MTAMRCPACGGAVDIAYHGPNKNRVAVCRFCQTCSDVPETRGTTEEKITETPDGSKVIERVTHWEGPTPPGSGGGIPLGDGLVVYNGKQYPSLAALEETLRKNMPADEAEKLIKELKAALAAGASGQTTSRVEETITMGPAATKDLPPAELEKMKEALRKKYPGAVLQIGNEYVPLGESDPPRQPPSRGVGGKLAWAALLLLAGVLLGAYRHALLAGLGRALRLQP